MLMVAAPMACSAPENSVENPVPPVQTPDNNDDDDDDDDNRQEQMNMKIVLKIGGREFAATLEDNASAREFARRLPLTLEMEELNGNEKYCYLSESLPANATRPGTITSGDLMLYGNSCVVLFYKSFTSGYSYTRLGALDTSAGIESAVGRGSVTVTFEIAE